MASSGWVRRSSIPKRVRFTTWGWTGSEWAQHPGDHRRVPRVREGDRLRATTAEARAGPDGNYPDADPADLVAGSAVFRRRARGAAPLDELPTIWWEYVNPGSRAGAIPEGHGEHRRGRDDSPRRPDRVGLRRRAPTRAWAGKRPAHRGRVGVRRPRRFGSQAPSSGATRSWSGVDARPTPGRDAFLGEPARRRLPRHVAGRQLPRQPVRTLRHHRKRLGVDDGLLLPRPHGGREEHLALGQLLRAAQPAGSPRAASTRSRAIHAEWSRAGPTCVPPTTVCATGRRPGRVRRRRRRRPTSAFAASSDPCPDR